MDTNYSQKRINKILSSFVSIDIIINLLLLLILSFPIYAKGIISIHNALDRGLIHTKARGDGLESVILLLTSKDVLKDTLLVTVGTYFKNNSNSQDMVTIKADTIIFMNETNITKSIICVCADLDKEVPDSTDSFTIHKSSEEPELNKLLNYMAENPASQIISQVSVWITTGNVGIEKLNSKYSKRLINRSLTKAEDEPAASNDDVVLAVQLLEESGINVANKKIFSEKTAFIKGLYSKEDKIRTYSKNMLGVGNQDPFEFITEMIENKNVEFRRASVKWLVHINDPRKIEMLLNAVTDSDRLVRSEAIKALIELKASNELVTLLESIDSDLRWRAVTGLGEIQEKSSADALTKAIADKDKSVSYEATISLAKLGDLRAIKPLIEILESGNLLRSKWEAIRLIQSLGDSSSVVPILEKLVDTEGSFIAFAAVDALINYKAFSVLEKLMKDTETSYINYYILQSLRKERTEKSVKCFEENLVHKHPVIRFEATQALLEIKKIDLLSSKLNDQNPLYIIDALRALGQYKELSILDTVKSLIKHPDFRVRYYAYEALGNIGCQDEIPFMIESLKTESNYLIRQIGISSIMSIGYKPTMNPNNDIEELLNIAEQFPIHKFFVVHNHSVGSCCGELIISKGVLGYINLTSKDIKDSFFVIPSDGIKVELCTKSLVQFSFSGTQDGSKGDVPALNVSTQLGQSFDFCEPLLWRGNVYKYYYGNELDILSLIYSILQDYFGLRETFDNKCEFKFQMRQF